MNCISLIAKLLSSKMTSHFSIFINNYTDHYTKLMNVASRELESPTFALSGHCSNQLSYEAIFVVGTGFEPVTSP